MANRDLLASTAGLLLAGGLSTRFGAEKAVARLHDGLLMDAVSERFAPFSQYAVSARPGSAAEQHALTHGIDVLHDNPSHPRGPLSGLAAGLMWANKRGFFFVATAPCDTPMLPLDLFPTLLDQLREAPAAFAVTMEGPNPLCAVWRTDVLSNLVARLTDHHPSVQSFHADLGSVAVQFEEASAFVNANTREVLAALEGRS